MYKISEREQKILDYMKAYLEKWGYPPTVRDISAALGIKSTSTVHKAIGNLEAANLIKKQAGKRRAMDIVETPAPKKQEESLRADVVEIPVVGRIAAGTPILAEENIEDSFPLPSRFLGRGISFMLIVKGQSMVEAGIFDGDYILVEQRESANNGDIVVAIIDGMESEATVKAFYRENGRIRLQPRNSEMAPIIVDDCKIVGLVKGVFRYLN